MIINLKSVTITILSFFMITSVCFGCDDSVNNSPMKTVKQNNSSFQKAIDFENANDLTSAIFFYKKAASEGNITAKYNLGRIYSQEGKAKDISQAIYWYTRQMRKLEMS